MKTVPVAYDSTSYLIRGERRFIISGEIHFNRSPRELWPDLLDRSVQCGINTVCTYCFWNVHEPKRDVFDFSGQADLAYFVGLCHERNLNVILRIGPYCCAEWNFGGYPAYLRDEPGIVIRTMNEPYLRRVEVYFRHLIAEVRPLLATQGGPVILVQVENEYDIVAERYGPEGRLHLSWLKDLTVRSGIDVPIVMCSGDAEAVGATGHFRMADGTLTAVNGFGIPAERVAGFRRDHPDMPLFWSELWTAWYDTWGFHEHLRETSNICYWILDFLGRGGAGLNYYMWHAGTNFGRSGMYLQPPSYGLDAPLDEYGRPTLKAEILAKLHAVIQTSTDLLFDGVRTKQRLPSGVEETVWQRGERSLRLLVNPTADASYAARLIDHKGEVVFDTSATSGPTAQSTPSWAATAPLSRWLSWSEPLPERREDGAIEAIAPIEQLSLTRDDSDYCWYSARIECDGSGMHTLEITHGGDFFYVLIDGLLVSQSSGPFRENRGYPVPETSNDQRIVTNIHDREQGGFNHRFTFAAREGPHQLTILSAALGMIKGDWQIAHSMNHERKGIWGDVLMDGARIENWRMNPFLLGEQLELNRRFHAPLWSPATSTTAPFTWHTASFAIAEPEVDADFRLDAGALGKGMLYVNGHFLCRHWLIAADGYGPDQCWHDLKRYGLSIKSEQSPTQSCYHIPRSWLRRENRLTLFEEQSADLSRVRIERRPASG